MRWRSVTPWRAISYASGHGVSVDGEPPEGNLGALLHEPFYRLFEAHQLIGYFRISVHRQWKPPAIPRTRSTAFLPWSGIRRSFHLAAHLLISYQNPDCQEQCSFTEERRVAAMEEGVQKYRRAAPSRIRSGEHVPSSAGRAIRYVPRPKRRGSGR